MKGLKQFYASKDTGTISGHCPQCNCYITITNAEAKQQIIDLFARMSEAERESIQRYEALAQKRKEQVEASQAIQELFVSNNLIKRAAKARKSLQEVLDLLQELPGHESKAKTIKNTT